MTVDSAAPRLRSRFKDPAFLFRRKRTARRSASGHPPDWKPIQWPGLRGSTTTGVPPAEINRGLIIIILFNRPERASSRREDFQPGGEGGGGQSPSFLLFLLSRKREKLASGIWIYLKGRFGKGTNCSHPCPSWPMSDSWDSVERIER